jgi:hypothetical protein
MQTYEDAIRIARRIAKESIERTRGILHDQSGVTPGRLLSGSCHPSTSAFSAPGALARIHFDRRDDGLGELAAASRTHVDSHRYVT